MGIKQIIKKLSKRNGLFVSFYLPIKIGETRREFVTTFRSRLKDLRHTAKNLIGQEEKYLGATLNKIENFLETADTHKTKTLVIFAGKNLFEVFRLPVELPLRLHIDTKPLISPLSKAFEENPPFLLVLIDRQSARLIEVSLGEEEVKSKVIKSEVPKRILARGDNVGRESKILRHIEDHLRRHLEKVLAETKKFEKAFPGGLIVVGAQRELVGRFKDLLPKALRKKVIGNFGADVDDNETEIINKAYKIINDYLERKAWHEV